MPVARPSRYPQVAGVPGGNFAEPTSGVQLGGWPTGAIYPSSDANWLWRQITDWNRHHDATRLASTDILTTTVCRTSTTALTITTGAGLTATITTGGVYYGAGERLDLTAAPTVYSAGAALVFPAGTTRYVCARPQPPTGGASNGASCAELIVSASNPPAGYVTILAVTTNGTDITAAVESGVTLYLEWAATPNFTAGVRGTTADFTGSLEALDVTTGAFSGSYGLFGGENGNPSLTVQGPANGLAPAILCYGLGSAASLYAYSNGGSGHVVHADAASFSATGKALVVDGNSTATAAEITAGAGRRAILATASATSSYAAEFVGGTSFSIYATGGTGGGGGLFYGTGTGVGIRAYGGSTAGANAIGAVTRNATGYAFYGETDGSATTAAAAAWLEGKGSAAGAEITSANFYALALNAKNSAPTYGSIYARPQTLTPTSWGDGSLTYASSVFGEQGHWMHGCSADSAFRGVWSSLGGFGYGASYNATNSNANAASFTVLTTATMSAGNAPKNTGTVRVTVNMRVKTSTAAANGIDVQVLDTTAGGTPTVISYIGTGAGTGTAGPGWYLQGSTTEYQTTISFEMSYAVPASGARTFSLQFKRQTAANTVTAQGSIVVTGVY